MNVDLAMLGGPIIGDKIPIINRGVLPSFDKSDGTFQVYTELPKNSYLPTKPQKNFPIANWFSVEVPGLPWVDGQSSEHPEMLLSYFLPKYDQNWREKGLVKHAEHGYSHFMSHWGVARTDLGMSISSFVDLALEIKSYIPFHHVMLAGKGDPRDTTWNDKNGIRSVVEPVLEALIEAKAVDMVAMFETNMWNIPGPPLQSIINGISAICKPNNVDQWVHFSTYTVFWGPEGRTKWWADQVGVLTGILFQGDVDWKMGMRQDIILTTTNKPSAAPLFADGTFKFCAAEMDGMSIYKKDFSEDISDLHGYEHLCTPGAYPVYGCCSGVRLPNGDAILSSLEV